MRKPLKILVADDESIIRLGLKTMLTTLGHEVLLASNGRSDGLEAARTIAQKYPMPILILTAYSEQDLIERAAQLPIQGYLIKPVNERDLAAAIPVAIARFEEAQTLAREKAELQESLETRKLVDRAKGKLMQNGMSEEEAYLALQRRAREGRISMRQAAEAILAQATSHP